MNLPSNHRAYLSRLLNERYLVLEGVLTFSHLDREHKNEAVSEKRLIEKIQLELSDGRAA